MSLLCQQQGSPPSSYPVPNRGRHADVIVKIKLYSFGNKNIESAHQCTSSHLKTAEHIGLKSRGGKGRSQPPRKVREGPRAALCSPPRFAAPMGSLPYSQPDKPRTDIASPGRKRKGTGTRIRAKGDVCRAAGLGAPLVALPEGGRAPAQPNPGSHLCPRQQGFRALAPLHRARTGLRQEAS